MLQNVLRIVYASVLYHGAKRAVAVIPLAKPHTNDLAHFALQFCILYFRVLDHNVSCELWLRRIYSRECKRLNLRGHGSPARSER